MGRGTPALATDRPSLNPAEEHLRIFFSKM